MRYIIKKLFTPRLLFPVEIFAGFFLFAFVILLIFFHINETRINREKIAIFSHTVVEEQLKFMQRTVDRWEQLQNNNPQIKVPLVVEPSTKATLKPEDMERKRVN